MLIKKVLMEIKSAHQKVLMEIKSAHQKMLMKIKGARTDQKPHQKCSQYSCVQKKKQSGHRKSPITDKNKQRHQSGKSSMLTSATSTIRGSPTISVTEQNLEEKRKKKPRSTEQQQPPPLPPPEPDARSWPTPRPAHPHSRN